MASRNTKILAAVAVLVLVLVGLFVVKSQIGDSTDRANRAVPTTGIGPLTEDMGEAPGSPKAALRLFFAHVAAMDAAAIRGDFHGGTPEADQLADAIAESNVAQQRLQQRLIERYGRVAPPFPHIDLTRKLELVEDSVSGDRAMLTIPEWGQKMTMVKVDGRWRIDLGELLAQSQTPISKAEVSDATRRTTRIFEQLAEEIKAGKFETEEQVVSAYKQRMAAATAAAPSTTTSAPAGQ
jgi:hypothetical protein